jgi:chemotaxis protein MotB
MNSQTFILVTAFSLVGIACVSSKKYKSLTKEYETLNSRQASLQTELTQCNTDKNKLIGQQQVLNEQMVFLKENNTQALNQLQNMSVISQQQAESIKKSMENIGVKDAYIQTLQQQMAQKDSLNMALVMNLKGAIGNLADEDINIKVDKGVVIIDISDKMLFKSGSYEITERAKEVLSKVAKVLKNQPDIQYMVEGHTDNVPFKGNKILVDNWDLSVKRATTVVRLLQQQYGMDPQKMLAAGRSEYNPVGENTTEEGKALNRRTRIVILPELDQFFKLLESQPNT